MIYSVDERNIVIVILNRVEKYNVFDDEMINEFICVFKKVGEDVNVCVFILWVEGKSFSVGVDFNWMKKMVSYIEVLNESDVFVLVIML